MARSVSQDVRLLVGGVGGPVREIFIIHVGGTRCATSSTDNTMNIQARITLNVECIRSCIFIFSFDV